MKIYKFHKGIGVFLSRRLNSPHPGYGQLVRRAEEDLDRVSEKVSRMELWELKFLVMNKHRNNDYGVFKATEILSNLVCENDLAKGIPSTSWECFMEKGPWSIYFGQ